MKNIEPSQVEQLLEIIQSKPGQRIVHFSDGSPVLTDSLSDLCKTHDSAYQLYCTKDTCYDESMHTYEGQDHIRITKFNLRRPRYLMQGIEFDYLITTLDFSEEDKAAFLEKCYPIIRTGGNIIIIIPNAGYSQRDEWQEILEEQYYVSVNIIDNFFEDYDVIVAKRMHGWGNT
jgi:phospholipid N-methyltransferase